MPDLTVPKLNNNDDSYLILEWFTADGAEVTADEPLVLLETSKAVEEITAPLSGALRVLRPANAECSPGEVIATIEIGIPVDAAGRGTAASGTGPEKIGATAVNPPATTGLADAADVNGPAEPAQLVEPVLTAAARSYASAHAISAEQIAGLGRRVVRVQDLTELSEQLPAVAAAGTGSAVAPTTDTSASRTGSNRSQAGVASTVAQAALIPAAYSLMQLDAEPYRALTAALIDQGRRVPAPLELLLKIVAGLPERHARLYVPGDDAIGVTVDAGNGLFVPVIREAGSTSLTEIGDQLTRFGQQARRGGFTGAQLTGARISISVTAYADVVFTVPLVFPGQVAMLSLGMLGSRVTLDGDRPIAKAYLPLGISYDHRVVNGRDAVRFLRAIGRRFADRDWLQQLGDQQPTPTDPTPTGSSPTDEESRQS